MSAIMVATSAACFVLRGLATLYLEATSILERTYLSLLLMHFIGNRYFVMRSVDMMWRRSMYLPDSLSRQPLFDH